MKALSQSGIIVMCCILWLKPVAQITPPLKRDSAAKPFLFNHLPEKYTINTASIQKLFDSPGSGIIKFPLADNNSFEGTIAEKVQKNKYVITINIRSSNYDGALFTLSQITGADHSITYIGRITSIRYGDLLTLTKHKGQYYLTKEKQSLFLVE